ncbi:MAG: hypothetical protein K6G94_05960, partial [Kiritimatiellae bacterium]|nr:hypothetical protein [Kiritimatiellia bacterium]
MNEGTYTTSSYYARTDRNSSVTISGGTYTGRIVAGGYSTSTGAASAGGTATLTIGGGTFTSATLDGGVATGTRTLAVNASIAPAVVTNFDAIAVGSGATLTLTGGTQNAPITYDASVSGAGALAIASGAAYITGANTLSSSITVASGAYLFMDAGEEGTVAVTSDGTVTLYVTSQQASDGYTASGIDSSVNVVFVNSETGDTYASSGNTLAAQGITWDGGAGTLNWNDADNWSGNAVPTTNDLVVLSTADLSITVTSSSAAKKVLVKANTTLSGVTSANLGEVEIAEGKTLTVNTTAASIICGVSGSGTLLKTGANIWLGIKNGAQSGKAIQNTTISVESGIVNLNYEDNGNTIVDSPTIIIGENGRFTNWGWVTVNGTITIESNYDKTIFDNTGNATDACILGSPAIVKNGSGTITIDSGNYGSSASVPYGNVTINAGTLAFSSARATEISGVVSGSGALSVTGTGVVTCDSVNTYTGTTTIGSGSVLTFKSASVGATSGLAGAGTVRFTIADIGNGLSNITQLTSPGADWTGTVQLYNSTLKYADFDAFGSKITMTGVSGYLQAPGSYDGEVVLEDNGSTVALEVNNGNSSQYYSFNKISGSGTLKTSDAGSANPNTQVFVKDASDFTGTVSAASSKKSIIFTDSTAFNSSYVAGNIVVDNGETVIVPSGKTWKTTGGVAVLSGGTFGGTGIVSGALTFVEGSTFKASSSALTVTGDLTGPATVDISGITAPTEATTLISCTGTLSETFTSSNPDYVIVLTSGTGLVVRPAEAVTIGAATFNYGVDFTNATIQVAVTQPSESITYTLTVNDTDYQQSASESGTVTFSGVAIPRGEANGTVSYTITSNGEVTKGTIAGSSKVADTTAWINENSTNTGTAAAGGTWSTEVTYTDSIATVADNTFTANSCSTGDTATVTFENVVYSSLSDLTTEIATGAQGAFAISTTGDPATTNFFILATNETGALTWTATTTTAATNTEYDIVMTFDYATKKYSVSVDGTALEVSGATAFDICTAGVTSLSSIEFKGSGTLTAITGEESVGYMVKDALGNFYATVAAAAAAYNKANGPYTLLHAGTAPDGYKIKTVDGVSVLEKIVKMMIFLLR